MLQGDHAHPEIPGILRAEFVRGAGPVVVAPGFERHIGAFASNYRAVVLPLSAARRDRFWVRSIAADLVSYRARPFEFDCSRPPEPAW